MKMEKVDTRRSKRLRSPDNLVDLISDSDSVKSEPRSRTASPILENRKRITAVRKGKESFECDLCGSKFSLKYNLARHKREKHPLQQQQQQDHNDSGTVNNRIMESPSKFIFTLEPRVLLHRVDSVKLEKFDESSDSDGDETVDSGNNNSNQGKMYSQEFPPSEGNEKENCLTCQLSFETMVEYNDHLEQFHDVVKCHCGKVFESGQDLEVHDRIVHQRIEEIDDEPESPRKKRKKSHLTCTCEAEFEKYDQLKEHLKTCTSERPLIFKCRIYCSNVYTDSWDRHDHEKVCCISDKPREHRLNDVCYVCFKICNGPKELRKHVHKKHYIAWFKCRKCEKMYMNHDRLSNHYINRHKRTLKCRKFCEQRFSYESKRMQHENKCKANSRRDQILCYACFKIFYSNADVQEHVQRKHYELVCKKCERYFRTYDELKNHYLRTHKGATKCQLGCQQDFKCDERRLKHEQICGTKNYERKSNVCRICFTVCANVFALGTHIGEEHEVMMCGKCEHIYGSYNALCIHFQNSHSLKNLPKVRQPSSDEEEVPVKKPRRDSSDDDHEVVGTITLSDDVSNDIDYNLDTKCGICHMDLGEVTLKDHIENNHPETKRKRVVPKKNDDEDTSQFYRCPKCYKTFRYKYSLQSHRERFHPSKNVSKKTGTVAVKDEPRKVAKNQPKRPAKKMPDIDPKDCKLCAFFNSINLKHKH